MFNLDQFIFTFIPSQRAPVLNKLMLFFTYLGDWKIILILFFITAGILFYLKRKQELMLLILSVGGGTIIAWVLKHLINRARPPFSQALVMETDPSLPSGHALISIVFYSTLTYFLLKIIKNKLGRAIIFVLNIILILGIGFSRIYLGVHWFSDVLVGWLIGFVWVILSMKITKKWVLKINFKTQ